MKQIRQSVFETNSSSSHSIVIKDYDDYDDNTRFFLHDGVLSLYEDEISFGRMFQVLKNFGRKMEYAFASYAENPEKREEIKSIVMKRFPNIKEIKFADEDYEGNTFYGYVDHSSEKLLDTFLKKHKIGIEEFLTNNKYIVIIDGDEYYIWNDIKSTGLINQDKIAEEINVLDLKL